MKVIIVALAILFLTLQYQLWFSKGGMLSAWQLQKHIIMQDKINTDFQKRNDELKTEISDFKKGKQALEEQARNDLGMIKKDEKFYQVVKHDD